MTGHSSLKTFPQLFTVTLKDTDCSLSFCFWAPISSMPPTVAKHCKKSKEPQEFPMGMVYYEWTLSFLIPPSRQLDTCTASQQNSLHNKEEAANRNKRLLEIQEKNLHWQHKEDHTHSWCLFPCTFPCACPFLSPVPHSPWPLQTFPSQHSLWCSHNCHSAAVGMYRILYKLSPLILWTSSEAVAEYRQNTL